MSLLIIVKTTHYIVRGPCGGSHTYNTYFVITRVRKHGYGHIGLGIARQRVRGGEKIRWRSTVFIQRFDDIDVGHRIFTTVVTFVVRGRTNTIIIKTIIHYVVVVFAIFWDFHVVFRSSYAYVGSHGVFFYIIVGRLKKASLKSRLNDDNRSLV